MSPPKGLPQNGQETLWGYHMNIVEAILEAILEDV